MGLGQGAGFSLGLVKLVDYAPTPAASARLSAMVFLFSYSLASTGPFLFGAVRDATDSFTIPFGALVVVAVVQLALTPRLRPGRTTEQPFPLTTPADHALPLIMQRCGAASGSGGPPAGRHRHRSRRPRTRR